MLKSCLVFIVLVMLAGITHASMTPLYVTSNADHGSGTLRQAILDGNNLPAGEYPDINITLGRKDPIFLYSPLPDITKDLVFIQGTHGTPAVINGLSLYSIFRITSSGLLGASLSNLTIKNGYHVEAGGCLYFAASQGTISINDVWFDNCVSADGRTGALVGGGALYAQGGTMQITNSRFTDNKVVGAAGAHGGAIQFFGNGDDSLDIDSTRFKGNQALIVDPAGGWASGGAVNVRNAELTISDSRLRNNQALAQDPADRPASGNSGGAIYSHSSRLSVYRSTFVMNESFSGGAIRASKGLGSDVHQGVILSNNTFVANSAGGTGAAVNVSQVDTTLRNNSFYANAADMGGNNFRANHLTGTTTVPSYHFWNNLFTDQAPGGSCFMYLSVQSGGYNLIPDTSCGLDGTATNVLSDAMPLQGYRVNLDAWYRDGYPLRFFADSAALDAGNPIAPDDNNVAACPTLDGQGEPRAADGDLDGTPRCDIGAFEWQREASLFSDDFEYRL